MGLLDVPRCVIWFYGENQGTPLRCLRFDMSVPLVRENAGKRPAAQDVASACRAFRSTIRLLPLDCAALAQQSIREWRRSVPAKSPSTTARPAKTLMLRFFRHRRSCRDECFSLWLRPPRARRRRFSI